MDIKAFHGGNLFTLPNKKGRAKARPGKMHGKVGFTLSWPRRECRREM